MTMESIDYWKLCDELSIVQAALLIVGEDPSSDQFFVERWAPNQRPKGYDAVKAALTYAIGAEALDVHFPTDYGIDEPPLIEALITTAALKKWLRARGLQPEFFFPEQTHGIPDYLDPTTERYASKLAAATSAWLAMEDGSRLKGKTPKQALLRWLRENAVKFHLCDDEGKLNEQGIQECAKVANWKEQGGAPKTLE